MQGIEGFIRHHSYDTCIVGIQNSLRLENKIILFERCIFISPNLNYKSLVNFFTYVQIRRLLYTLRAKSVCKSKNRCSIKFYLPQNEIMLVNLYAYKK